jgi:hypothetical protein
MGMPLSMALCRISQTCPIFLYKADKGSLAKIVDFITQESRKLPVYTISAANLCIRDSTLSAAVIRNYDLRCGSA